MSQAAPSQQPHRQTVEQQRAAFALECVRKVKREAFASKYRQLVRGLPAMILTNGLGQTLAFLKAKGGEKSNEHQTAYTHLSAWAREQLRFGPDLLEQITRMDVSQYRLAQTETLAVLGWLKRFADAELPEGKS